MCDQEETLDSDFNVFDQLMRHASIFESLPASQKNVPKTCCEQFGLTEKAREPIESLSGGLKRRLQVARALISDPRVLVLDEPTTGLDPDARRMVWEVLAQSRGRGVAILLSTHYMEEAQRLCDLRRHPLKGRILDIDSPAQLIATHITREIVEEEVRPGIIWSRAPNLEDVYLKLTGSHLGVGWFMNVSLADSVWGVWSVWRRYFSVFVKSIGYYLVTTFVEPLLYLLAFGVGVGSLIGTLKAGGVRLSYRSFIFSGIIAPDRAFPGILRRRLRGFCAHVLSADFSEHRDHADHSFGSPVGRAAFGMPARQPSPRKSSR